MAFGATDAKVTSLDLSSRNSYLFAYGPTLGTDSAGAFKKLDFLEWFEEVPQGVPEVLPIGDGQKFDLIRDEWLCAHTEQNCSACEAGYVTEGGRCVVDVEDYNYLPLILGISIPFTVIILGIVVALVIVFMKKPAYQKIVEGEGKQENAPGYSNDEEKV